MTKINSHRKKENSRLSRNSGNPIINGRNDTIRKKVAVNKVNHGDKIFTKKELKAEEFASKLCNKLENRVVEICTKFAKGNVNMASLPAFWMGLEGDITSFIEENKLKVVKK